MIAIVAALERELAPLVHGWRSSSVSHSGHRFRVQQHADLVAVAGGIGQAAAAMATNIVVEQYRPHVLISAGVAGSLQRDLQAGSVFVPQLVIDGTTGVKYPTGSGEGILVTTGHIADSASKQLLRDKFQAAAVDMEAAAVAAVACREGIAFRCIKGISDALDFEMPPLQRFVNESGRLHTARFALWAALHPGWWPRIATLAGNTNRAAKVMCDCLSKLSNGNLEACFGARTGECAKS